MGTGRDIGLGLVAGAAGTVALNATTYLDMAVRGRPASSMPAQTVDELADDVGVDLAGGQEQDVADQRAEGLGALLGFVTGLGCGAVYGLVAGRCRRRTPVPVGAAALTLAAMAGANVPASVTGVTDPRTWGVQGWAADLVPHLLYGFVTATVHDAIT